MVGTKPSRCLAGRVDAAWQMCPLSVKAAIALHAVPSGRAEDDTRLHPRQPLCRSVLEHCGSGGRVHYEDYDIRSVLDIGITGEAVF